MSESLPHVIKAGVSCGARLAVQLRARGVKGAVTMVQDRGRGHRPSATHKPRACRGGAGYCPGEHG